MFLSDELIINGYKKGIFPMAESSDDPYVFWVNPEKRGVIFVDDFIVSKSLRKRSKRTQTWINKQIIESYTELYNKGFAKSVECYQTDKLVGGLYGVQIGGIFFGESMFSFVENASKVALAYLKEGGFMFIDTQFLTEHLKQFGAKEISRSNYHKILKDHIDCKKNFPLKLKKKVYEYF